MSFKPVLITSLVHRAGQVLTQRSFGSTQQLRSSIQNHQPNELEKRFLVWTGKYKSRADVPTLVSQEVMERCRNKMRIRVANIMIGLTAIGCIIMVYSGKQAAKRGESVSQMNLEWHRKMNEATGDSAKPAGDK